MPYKDKKKAREASREAMRRKRAGLTPKGESETVKPSVKPKPEAVKPITDADIALLPPSLQFQLQQQTRVRQLFKLPDNLKERTEAMVRRFRGY